MTDPFTPADVAAVIQAARLIGAGGAGPLPVLSEHLSKIANKVADTLTPAYAARLEPDDGMQTIAAEYTETLLAPGRVLFQWNNDEHGHTVPAVVREVLTNAGIRFTEDVSDPNSDTTFRVAGTTLAEAAAHDERHLAGIGEALALTQRLANMGAPAESLLVEQAPSPRAEPPEWRGIPARWEAVDDTTDRAEAEADT